MRIEFWDDEIDSIRTFDVETQRSVENREEITFYPGIGYSLRKTRSFFLQYFQPEETLLFWMSLQGI